MVYNIYLDGMSLGITRLADEVVSIIKCNYTVEDVEWVGRDVIITTFKGNNND